MAELRVGHDQVVLTVRGPVKFRNGAIHLTAEGSVTNDKLQKLTGSQPIVVVGDDGQIIATWHNDLTESCAEARRFKANYLYFNQEWKILSVQDM